MIKLVDQPLSAAALAQLAIYQTQIDNEQDYPAKVQKAKAMWRPRNATFNEITNTLIAMCPGTHRCCYCEDAIGEDIEHFKPKNLYPELTFEWTNYLFACSACNSNAKRDKFAVIDNNGGFHDVTRGSGAAVLPPTDGEPALINPRFEDPLDFLRIDLLRTFHFLPRPHLSSTDSQRAKYTIKILQLNNRTDLVAWRKSAYGVFVGWIDTYRRYKNTNQKRLTEHQNLLKSYTHLAVWEEMKRVYRERNPQQWAYLTNQYVVIRELDDLFQDVPEVLQIGV